MIKNIIPQYRRVLDYAISQSWCLPSIKVQTAQNQYFKRRIAIGLHGLDDLLYMFVNDACDINFSRINWRNPGSFTLSVNGSLTFTPNVGITNPGTAWLGTGWIPSTHAIATTNIHCGIEWYPLTHLTNLNEYDWGNTGGTSSFRCNMQGGSQTQFSFFDGPVNVTSFASGTAGHWMAYRTSASNNGNCYRNGVDTTINTGGFSATIPTTEVSIFRHGSDYSNRGSKMFAIGNGDYYLYVGGHTNTAYAIIQDYLNAIA